jgi:hypothetical protein
MQHKRYVRPDRRRDYAIGFVADPIEPPVRAHDDLAEELAEDYLTGATSAEHTSAELDDTNMPEDIGGPFVETTGAVELADDEESDR